MNLHTLHAYARLMRLDKPVGLFLLLWPTLMALWIAGDGHPPANVVLIFVLGVISMRSAGCVINDLADRKFDAHVRRTCSRPLVIKDLSLKQAVALLLLLLVLSMILVLGLNRLSIQWSLVALCLAMIYPFMKRYIHWPQMMLGAAFAMSIPMAFAALNRPITGIAGWLYLMTLLWTLMFDTQYAMVDREDDQKIGVKSTALLLGDWDRLILAGLQFAVTSILLTIGFLLKTGWIYYAGVFGSACLFAYQQYLIRDRDPAHCFAAFLNNQWVGACLFLGLAIDFIF